jgi:CDP-diacylglycerol--serine O-phosphatidyltransferase
MPGRLQISKKISAVLVYGRPPLVFAGLICALAVMWNRDADLYRLGAALLFISMCCDLVDGWFASRYELHSVLSHLADRVMDKIVYSIIFPLVAVGTMWKLHLNPEPATRPELLHAILVLLLAVAVLIRDNFAGFMRFFAIRTGVEPEPKEFTRLRTLVAAPVGALLYLHAFYIPGVEELAADRWLSSLANLPLQFLFAVEIIFMIITLGSIAAYARKYGSYALDEICDEDELLRRRILSFFPNSLTVMNAMMGILALFFAYQVRVREMYLFMVGAALFDKLDGALARRLGLTAPMAKKEGGHHISFGGVMDDLADATSFCIVPAWCFYILVYGIADLPFHPMVFKAVAVGYALLGVVRLIYFTLDRSPVPGFFKGLPTPAAALLVAAPLIMLGQADTAALQRFWGGVSVALMVLAAVAMNLYPVRYIHVGRFIDKHSWFGRLNLLLLIIFALTPLFGYFVLCYMLFYLVSPFFTWRMLPTGDADGTPVESTS